MECHGQWSVKKKFSVLELSDNCASAVHSFLWANHYVYCIYWRFLYIPISALHRRSLSTFRLARRGNVVSPVRDCLKRIRIQLINSVSRSHLPVEQARNKVMLLFKDMTCAHSNCFSGQKEEHKGKTGVSEWTELLEKGTGYKINLWQNWDWRLEVNLETS
jgi:hypothetical protein